MNALALVGACTCVLTLMSKAIADDINLIVEGDVVSVDALDGDDVGIREILENPRKFDGVKVRARGTLVFEDAGLWLYVDDDDGQRLRVVIPWVASLAKDQLVNIAGIIEVRSGVPTIIVTHEGF